MSDRKQRDSDVLASASPTEQKLFALTFLRPGATSGLRPHEARDVYLGIVSLFALVDIKQRRTVRPEPVYGLSPGPEGGFLGGGDSSCVN